MTRRSVRSIVSVVAVALLATFSPALLHADDEASVTGHVDVSPLVVSLSVSPTTSPVGKPVRADVRVTNIGAVRVSNVLVEVRAATDGLRIKSGTPQTLSKLKPGETGSIGYTVCGQKPGNYIVLARATLAGKSVESAARLLTITPGKERGC
jgi:uncharacterized protein (DUF58 family)